MNFLNLYFIFTTNSDVKNSLIFGKDINTWLVYALIIFGLTFVGFAWVWLYGLLLERNSGESFKQPWE